MAIQIKKSGELIEVFGALDRANMTELSDYLQLINVNREFLMLSLDNVTSMECTSAKQLEYLYLNAAAENKVLTIIGDQNQNILPVMHTTKTKYILSHDRV